MKHLVFIVAVMTAGCQAIAGLNGAEPYPPDAATSTCATNELNCGSTCADPATNASHCGRCGNACPNGVPCVGGTCQCPGGLTGCDGACVDTKTNNAHCGACGEPCGTDMTCEAGQCLLLECEPGTNDCNGDAGDGCETNGECTCVPGEMQACYTAEP